MLKIWYLIWDLKLNFEKNQKNFKKVVDKHFLL